VHISSIPLFVGNITELRAFLAWAPEEKRLEIIKSFSSEWLRKALKESDEVADIFSRMPPDQRNDLMIYILSSPNTPPQPKEWLKKIELSDTNLENGTHIKLDELTKKWGIDKAFVNNAIKKQLENVSPSKIKNSTASLISKLHSHKDKHSKHQTMKYDNIIHRDITELLNQNLDGEIKTDKDLEKLNKLIQFQDNPKISKDLKKKIDFKLREIRDITLEVPLVSDETVKAAQSFMDNKKDIQSFTLKGSLNDKTTALIISAIENNPDMTSISIKGGIGKLSNPVEILENIDPKRTTLSLLNPIKTNKLIDFDRKPAPILKELLTIKEKYSNLKFTPETLSVLEVLSLYSNPEIDKIWQYHSINSFEKLNALYNLSQSIKSLTLDSDLKKVIENFMNTNLSIIIDENLTTIRLEKSKIMIIEVLKSNMSIKHVSFGRNDFLQNNADELLDTLAKCKNLESITLQGNFIAANNLIKLANRLMNAGTTIEIDEALNENQLVNNQGCLTTAGQQLKSIIDENPGMITLPPGTKKLIFNAKNPDFELLQARPHDKNSSEILIDDYDEEQDNTIYEKLREEIDDDIHYLEYRPIENGYIYSLNQLEALDRLASNRLNHFLDENETQAIENILKQVTSLRLSYLDIKPQDSQIIAMLLTRIIQNNPFITDMRLSLNKFSSRAASMIANTFMSEDVSHRINSISLTGRQNASTDWLPSFIQLLENSENHGHGNLKIVSAHPIPALSYSKKELLDPDGSPTPKAVSLINLKTKYPNHISFEKETASILGRINDDSRYNDTETIKDSSYGYRNAGKSSLLFSKKSHLVDTPEHNERESVKKNYRR
jgi:hypothetical protein